MTATATEVTKLPLANGQVALPHRVKHADPRTEVGKLGEAFNAMLGHVESALARRHASEARLRSFAADASHELRTPLAAIMGYTELAQRKADELPPDLRRALERVGAESARMSGLVDDLLLLARLDAGRPLERQPVDLTRLAIDATSDARVAAPSHRWLLDLSRARAGARRRAEAAPGTRQPAQQRGQAHAGRPTVTRRRRRQSGRRHGLAQRHRRRTRGTRRTAVRACSSGSSGATRPARGRRAAPALASRSWTRSPRRTAAAST